MATFPLLKTGAVAQYPLQRGEFFLTEIVAFLDGSEQRFRSSGADLRRWVVRLDWLDESEMVMIEQFFLSLEGTAMNFAFTDPYDATVYQNCSLENEDLTIQMDHLFELRTAIGIRQNRGS